ncbi:MAG: DEAD/DEAH box helicase family protein [Treponema sp.]|nr:DEAD/DEAH box helicase family protein [Treponema sp.]
MNLMNFQRKAISQIQEAIESGKEEVIFKSCTGSGKTIMLTHFMDEYLKSHANTVFIWFTPGKGNLEEQSKKKMDAYIHGAHTKLLGDVMTGGFLENDCCFINWELLNKNDNLAVRNGEHTNFIEYIQKARDAGLNFILIIDESHMNDSKKSAVIINYFKDDKSHSSSCKIPIIRASATPNGYDHNNPSVQFIEVPETDVIEEGLIKKMLIINEGFPVTILTNEITKLEGETQVSYLLNKALEKQKDLRSKFLKFGENVNPLILVQMPNSSDALLDEVQKWFEEHGISFENGKLAIWLSENGRSKFSRHENLDGIEDNCAEQEALIFKMAVATGWDCPRAHILVKLRDHEGEKFEVQTFGRIRRMPNAHHYGDNSLDSCYLYTWDNKFTEGAKAFLDHGAWDAAYIHLKDEFKSVSLKSQQRPDVVEENDAEDTMKSVVNHYQKKYSLSVGKKLGENKTLLQKAGYVFSDRIVVSAKMGRTETLNASAMNKMYDSDFAIPLNTHTHGRQFHHEVGILGTELSLKYETMITVIRRIFYKASKDSSGKYPLLELGVRELYSFVINNADRLKDDFHEAITELDAAVQKTLTFDPSEITEKEFHIPHVCLFTYDGSDKSQKIYSKNVYADYRESAEVRSMPERKFEEFCEHCDFVKWFYKNGDKGTDFYSVAYKDGSGKIRLFYPDYVLGTIDGIWIIETKGGFSASGQSQNIDDFAPRKFEVLKGYLTANKLKGGFVRTNRKQKLCICTERFSDDIDGDDWQLLEDVMK